MWPDCVNNLARVEIPLAKVPPGYVADALRECGWPAADGEPPVRIVALLGNCRTAAFPECPTLPDWHAENDARTDRTYGVSEGMYYYWFDFDLIDSKGKAMPLRMAYNIGDADSNDGHWGIVWDRDKGKPVAHMQSVGDCQTAIAVVSPAHEKKFKPHALSGELGGQHGVTFANNSQLERLIGVALAWHGKYLELLYND